MSSPDGRTHHQPPTPKPKRTPKPPQQSSKLRGLPTDALPVKLSKTVSYLLRHGAAKEGLDGGMRPDGYLPVEVLMSHRSFLDLKTKEPILDLPFLTEMVLLDSKSRFSLVYASAHPPAEELLRPLTPSSIRHAPSADGEDLDERGKGEAGGRRREEKTEEEGRWWIRANQGHSIKVDKLEDSMKKVESVEDAGDAVHGTRRELWDVIYETGLSKMNRQHIHMALSAPPLSSSSTDATPTPTSLSNPAPSLEPSPTQPTEPTETDKPQRKPKKDKSASISGIRNQSTLYIYLDVPLLLAHSVPLFLSANSVLLSPGDPKTPGIIGREYFLRAVDRKDGRVVWERDGGVGDAALVIEGIKVSGKEEEGGL